MAQSRTASIFNLFDKRIPAAHVLIPVYNAENYIIHAIQSVFRQSYKNTTILIYGDGCTDNTINLIKDFIKSNPHLSGNIFLQYSHQNCGVAFSRQVLIKWSKETNRHAYLFWLDADDQYVYKDFIKQAINKLQETDSDVCLFNFDIAFENESQIKNAAGLIKDRENSLQVLKAIVEQEGGAVTPDAFPDLLNFTSVGCAKCYSPAIELPVPLNCPFEDFVYMAALLTAKKITSFSPDIMPVQYLRRGDSICGKRKETHFTHDIPEQLKRFFDVINEGRVLNQESMLLQMAKDFIDRKVKQYSQTLNNLINDQYAGITESTRVAYINKTQELIGYINNQIRRQEVWGGKIV